MSSNRGSAPRWHAGRGIGGIVVFAVLLGVIVVTRSRMKNNGSVEVVHSPTRAAARKQPPATGGQSGPRPDCRQIRSCLEGVLPKTYDARDQGEVINKALPCVGGSHQAAWGVAQCLDFEFARDASTGAPVTLQVTCADVCPDYAQLRVAFSTRLSSLECTCLGMQGITSPGWGAYAGCAPLPAGTPARSPTLVPGKDFTLRTGAPGPLGPRDEVDVYGGGAVGELGFPRGIQVETVDGARVRDAKTVERLLAGLPNELPASVGLRNEVEATTPYSAELHYVTRETAEELSRLLAETRFTDLLGSKSPCLRRGPNQIQFWAQRLRYDPQCQADETTRLERVAEAVRRAARATRRRQVRRPRPADECRHLDALTTSLALWEGERKTSLLYVDWMAR